jgi:hypothetical protein
MRDMKHSLPSQLNLPAALGEILLQAGEEFGRRAREAYQIELRDRGGSTLRPGRETPLWNQLCASIRPYLEVHGAQAQLGRMLGIPRQRVHEFFRSRQSMPDAERVLQLVAWLGAVRAGQPPS